MAPAYPRSHEERTVGRLAIGWTAAVVVFWVVLFVPSMRPDVDRTVAIDLGGYFFPKYVYGADAIWRGGLLWNPYEFAGFPFLGAGQPAALYPPRVVLFGLLPADLAIHAFMVLHFLALGAGGFWVLRVFGRSVLASAAGALVITFQPFMLNGQYAPHWISNFVWVPFILASFLRLLERPTVGMGVVLAVSLACELLAGYPEYVLDTGIVLAVLWAFGATTARREGKSAEFTRGTAAVVASGLLAVALTAVAWVPLLEAVRNSFRASDAVEFMFGMTFDQAKFGSGPRGFVAARTLLFYLPPLMWAALAAGFLAPRVPYRWTLVTLAVVSHAGVTEFRDWPPFSFFRGPLCWHSILHVPLAALAGAGIDGWLGATPSESASRSRLVGGVAVVLGVVLVAVCAPRAIAWMIVGFAALAFGRSGHGGLTTASAVFLLVMLGSVWTWLPSGVSPRAWHHYGGGVPPYPHRADGVARGEALRAACGPDGRVVAPPDTWTGVNLLARVPTPQGYPESLAPQRMSRLLDAAGLAPHTVFPLDWTRVAQSASTFRLLDVRCLVTTADGAAAARAAGFTDGPSLPDGRQAFTRAGAVATVVGQTVVVPDADAALAAVRTPDFDPATRVVLEEGDGRAISGAGGVATLQSPRAPGRMRFTTDAAADAMLVVSENWYPGWRATVDGQAVPVHRGDFTLLAVPVPAGRHTVELWYMPSGFMAAVAISSLALMLAGVGTALAWRSRLAVAA